VQRSKAAECARRAGRGTPNSTPNARRHEPREHQAIARSTMNTATAWCPNARQRRRPEPEGVGRPSRSRRRREQHHVQRGGRAQSVEVREAKPRSHRLVSRVALATGDDGVLPQRSTTKPLGAAKSIRACERGARGPALRRAWRADRENHHTRNVASSLDAGDRSR